MTFEVASVPIQNKDISPILLAATDLSCQGKDFGKVARLFPGDFAGLHFLQ